MKQKKRRVIDLLSEKFPHLTRDQCLSFLLCGEVVVNGEKVLEPARLVEKDASIDIIRKQYVSRGGIKLEFALKHWDLSVQGKVILDAGSSTGGFTDCLLQAGAAHVYAIDVGYNQIHPKFRGDPRVTVQEGTNIMAVGTLPSTPNGAVCDLSFRSLRGAARHILSLTSESWLLALVKPQFERRGAHADFKGVVRSEQELLMILDTLQESFEAEGVRTLGQIESPIRGRRGNREFFFFLAGAGWK